MTRPRSGVVIAVAIVLLAILLGLAVHPLLFVIAVLALLFVL